MHISYYYFQGQSNFLFFSLLNGYKVCEGQKSSSRSLLLIGLSSLTINKRNKNGFIWKHIRTKNTYTVLHETYHQWNCTLLYHRIDKCPHIVSFYSYFEFWNFLANKLFQIKTQRQKVRFLVSGVNFIEFVFQLVVCVSVCFRHSNKFYRDKDDLSRMLTTSVVFPWACPYLLAEIKKQVCILIHIALACCVEPPQHYFVSYRIQNVSSLTPDHWVPILLRVSLNRPIPTPTLLLLLLLLPHPPPSVFWRPLHPPYWTWTSRRIRSWLHRTT